MVFALECAIQDSVTRIHQHQDLRETAAQTSQAAKWVVRSRACSQQSLSPSRDCVIPMEPQMRCLRTPTLALSAGRIQRRASQTPPQSQIHSSTHPTRLHHRLFATKSSHGPSKIITAPRPAQCPSAGSLYDLLRLRIISQLAAYQHRSGNRPCRTLPVPSTPETLM